MARLYDRIISGRLGVGPGDDRGQWVEDIENATIIVADNVARYFYVVDDDGPAAYSDYFPNLAPPVREAWMEWRPGNKRRRNGRIEVERGMASEVGVFIKAGRSDGGGWVMFLALFATDVSNRDPGMACGPLGTVVVQVGEDGSWVPPGPGRDDVPVILPLHVRGRPAAQNQPIANNAVNAVKPALLAISFMHCKNVETREVVPPEALSKKWEKKHGRPQVTYKVLDIDPMKKTLESEGGASTHGLKKALHICRGHFAHYPDGLFNRGEPETVWRPQHVRGSASEGAVVKDYNVKAPPNEGADTP